MPKTITSEAFLRISEIIAPGGPLPISRSTWFNWVKDGRAPQPIKLGPRVTVYRVADLEAFMSATGSGREPSKT